MPVRAFLALDIPTAVRDALAEVQRQLDAPDAKIRWVAPENLHVTLKFLGDVADEQVAEVLAAAEQVARHVGPIPFDVRGIRLVPPRGRVRMVWAEINDKAAGITALHKRIEPALGALGFEPDAREFTPHITLGRIKFVRDHDALRRSAQACADENFGRALASDLVTYSSRLTPSGPIYTPLAKTALTGE